MGEDGNSEEEEKVIIPWTDDRPTNYYRDCVDRPRPCPWFGCKHNLMLDVNQDTGSITLNVGRKTVPNGVRGRPIVTQRRINAISARGSQQSREDSHESKMFNDGSKKLIDLFGRMVNGKEKPTCVLDCVENERSHTLEEVGVMMSVTRERIRQIESKAERRLRKMVEEGDHEEWMEMR